MKRFELVLKDESEAIVMEIPENKRSQFVREAIEKYAESLGRKRKEKTFEDLIK